MGSTEKRPCESARVVDAGAEDAPGVALIRRVRNSPDLKELFILGTTTGSWPNTEPKCLYAAGADLVHQKPCDPNVLLTDLAKGLEISGAPDLILLAARIESQSLDFKEKIALANPKDKASIAKDVIAMANYGGGKVIIGVAERGRGTFEHVGIPSDQLENYETTIVNKAIREFMTPHVAVVVRRVDFKNRTFVVLDIPGSDTIILPARDNADAKLFLGRIYSRSSAVESAEVRTDAEMRAIIDRVAAARMAVS